VLLVGLLLPDAEDSAVAGLDARHAFSHLSSVEDLIILVVRNYGRLRAITLLVTGDQPALEFPMPELHSYPGEAHQSCLVGSVHERCWAPRQVPLVSKEQHSEQIPRPR